MTVMITMRMITSMTEMLVMGMKMVRRRMTITVMIMIMRILYG